MLFNSIEFLLFFPTVTILYYVIPRKLRVVWLLFVSYIFYMGWNPKYALLLATSTLITYFASLFIGKCRSKSLQEADNSSVQKKWKILAKYCVGLSLTLNLLILFFFKYFTFAIDNINAWLKFTHHEPLRIPFDILLPVGISFYIFQALSYTIDVYRGDVHVEKNLIRYATYVSFFPQLVAGPIERSSHLLNQFATLPSFRFQNVRNGCVLMLWGFFQKIVIADRAAILVNKVFNYCTYFHGFELIVAASLFGVQIYGDFAGYSCIAIGAARVMGFDLTENFHQPYFAVSVADFWRRWHISLSTWFRDYLYIPLGGNRKGTVRKYINLMIVFLVSGLWHGANWTYIIWGGLNGALQVIGSLMKPFRQKAIKRIGMRTNSLSHRILQSILTFLMIDMTWIFFRANSLADAVTIFRNLFVFNPWVLTDGSMLALGLDRTEWSILLISLGILFVVSLLKECHIQILDALEQQETWFRWSVILGLAMIVLVYGVYGSGYSASAFIYFQF